MHDSPGASYPDSENPSPGQPYQPYQPYGGPTSTTGTPPTSTASTSMGYPQLSVEPSPPSGRRRAISIGVGVLSLFLIAAAFLVQGEASKFVMVGLQFVPLAILAALAYGALRSEAAAVFTYIWLALLMLLVVLNSFASAMLVVVNLDAVAGPQTPGVRPSLEDIFKPGAGDVLLWTMLLLALSLIISLSMLLRPVRVLLSRIMPIDPDNFVHKIGLTILALILFTSFVPLIALGGRPPILELINSQSLEGLGSLEGAGEDAVLSVRPIDIVYQFVWTIPATIVAAGWPIARNFPGALARLGMVRPTGQQVLFGIGAGVGLAVAAFFVLDPGITSLWNALGWQPTDVQAFERLLSQLITPVGAVLIGVTAGIGEEMAVRGLLQPRIGLIASNLVFTAFHAFQYGVDALLSVFIIGLVLGLIRARTNTSTSAIVHGVYDFVLIMASFFLAAQ